MNSATSLDRSPEAESYDRELSGILEKAILSLSDDHRHVFMLRDVEGLTSEETAQCFQFHALRCDRVVNGVFKSLGWKSLRTLNDSGD